MQVVGFIQVNEKIWNQEVQLYYEWNALKQETIPDVMQRA